MQPNEEQRRRERAEATNKEVRRSQREHAKENHEDHPPNFEVKSSKASTRDPAARRERHPPGLEC